MDDGVFVEERFRNIPYGMIDFPDKYKKLIKKISCVQYDVRSHGSIGENLGHLIDLDVDAFSKLPGVGEHYITLFGEFKNELTSMASILEETYSSLFSKADDGYLDGSEMDLEDPNIPERYQKLFARIRNLNNDTSNDFKISETVVGIASLSVSEFTSIPSVGETYVNLLKSFKRELPDIISDMRRNGDMERNAAIIDNNMKLKLSRCYLNYSYLTGSQMKMLRKIQRFDMSVDVASLLSLKKESFGEYGRVGASFFKQLSIVQGLLKNEIKAHDVLEYNACRRSFIVNSDFYEVSLTDVDVVLLEDVERYLFSIDEPSQIVALSRWGFHHEYLVLEDIAKELDITRERVRQIETRINDNLPQCISIHSKVLSQNIRDNISVNLEDAFPILRSCFESKQLFYSFLELLCREKKGAIRSIQEPNVPFDILNEYFCINSSPVSRDDLIYELTSKFGYNKALAYNTIRELVENAQLRIDDDLVSPANLSLKEGVSQVLLAHPNGLPWKDISRIVNNSGLCVKKIDEERLDNRYFDSSYVYQCDRGSYKHVKYIGINESQVPQILNDVAAYIKSRDLVSIHLNDYYYQLSGEVKRFDYFDVRHFVREIGCDYGLHFNGKSGVDSVSISPSGERVTQKMLIVQIMNEAKGALTKSEIASRLRSKSLAHATFYLDKMMDDGEVVRIDRMMYTTPERAFSDIDVESIICLIDDVMAKESRPIEVDYFRLLINRELNLGYTKYFYLALARHYNDEFGWSVVSNLVSYNEIQYTSMSNAMSLYCDVNMSADQCFKVLNEYILITKEAASSIFYNWKNYMKQTS
ncbi:MAG: sigma factor-like helix-turn-helix DNA-binding protein [Pseudomonadota bacterium]